MVAERDRLAFFFCIGTAKTGTTLLARVLDQHPSVACIWESYALVPRARASILNPQSEKWQIHGFSREKVEIWARVWAAEPKRFFRRLLRRATGRHFLTASCFRATMPELMADFAGRCGARAVGDKWPFYMEYLPVVRRVFPDARFIYTIRDPRGLWNSAQRFKNRNRGDEILNWMLTNDTILERSGLGQNLITVRYEDLVTAPEPTCSALYHFLGQDFRPGFLQYDPRSDPYPDRWDWIPEAREQFNSWHAVKWQQEMEPSEIARVNRMASEFMVKYGYE